MNTPTKQQVIDAAKAGPQAEKALKSLFPEAFEKKFSQGSLNRIADVAYIFKEVAVDLAKKPIPAQFMKARGGQTLQHKGFYLGQVDKNQKWEVVIDPANAMVLVPVDR